MFKIIKKDPRSWARTGLLETSHGAIATPAYVMVGTHGQIRCLPPELLSPTGIQVIIANTYHLWQNFQDSQGGLTSLPKVHDLLGQSLPIMTDSGGFQVFSLGFSREHGIGKISSIFPDQHPVPAGVPLPSFRPEKNLVHISKEGVYFTTVRQTEEFLGPELSIKIQEKLGADIIFTFDECTSPFHSYTYTQQALDRTHRWAKICLQAKTRPDQLLYGIVQGGEFRDLRETSARFISTLSFDGLAIGGSLGRSKDDARRVLEWTVPLLGEARPRHFLGMGQIEDIFDGVERGMDTFDCVIPTREARHARIWTTTGHLDITKACFKENRLPLEPDCLCPTCQSIDRQTLHQLFKTKNLLAGQYATVHNVFFFNHLLGKVRQAINEGTFSELKKEWLAKSQK